MLFDWLVVGRVLDTNPAHAVRGPKYSQKKGRTPVLDREEARALIAAIETNSLTGLRDRALFPTTQPRLANVVKTACASVRRLQVGRGFLPCLG